MPANIPASKCPNCGLLCRFDRFDLSDAPRRFTAPREGSAVICQACTQVNVLAHNLVLEACTDLEFVASAPVRAARWAVVEANDMTPPQDLVIATGLADGTITLGVADPVRVLVVWPTESGVDFPYLVSIGAPGPHELIATGTDVGGAELLFRLVETAWPLIDYPDHVTPGHPFTFATTDDYQLVMIPVDLDVATHLGLPALPDGGQYLQVTTQNEDGYWPWEPDGDDAPIVIGDDWRPEPGPPLVIGFGNETGELPPPSTTVPLTDR